MGTEATNEAERQGTLELVGYTTPMPIYYVVREQDGVPCGYLRLASGQGNFVNRLLKSVGQTGRLREPDGITAHIRIISAETREAPGYLCAFSFY